MARDRWIVTCISGGGEISGESYHINTFKITGDNERWRTKKTQQLMLWNELKEKKQEKVLYKLFYKCYLYHSEEDKHSTI